jgi:inner membrane protein
MPTILTHPAVPLALAVGLGNNVISRRLAIAGVVGSVLPDLDVLAFRFGIPYAAEFGHRGFSHSFLFALAVALAGACLFRLLRSTFLRSFLFLFVATASHGILDAFTNGGLGIAFLWPWSAERFFAPIQVIQVAPIGLSRFLSPRGAAVLRSEFMWVWLPLMGTAIAAAASRFLISTARNGRTRARSLP